jgi:DNA (cytosine-5)-methyltransferase 3A
LKNELNPKWFLLENVVMKQEYQDVISEHLGVKPIKINSSLVSAQSRNRLYWTNIPNVTQPEDKGIYFKDVSDESLVAAIRGHYVSQMVGRRCLDGVRKDYDTAIKIQQYLEPRLGGKSNCLTTVAKDNVVCLEPITTRKLASECTYRNLTRLECERLQTVPEGYTRVVSDGQAKRMLGNGWTVDVIAHILKGLK